MKSGAGVGAGGPEEVELLHGVGGARTNLLISAARRGGREQAEDCGGDQQARKIHEAPFSADDGRAGAAPVRADPRRFLLRLIENPAGDDRFPRRRGRIP